MGTALNPELVDASRCLLAVAGPTGPTVAPAGVWFDGAALWLLAPAGSPHGHQLMADPRCSGFVAPHADADVRSGLLFTGVARVFGVGDPLGLALHGPTLVAALGALALKQASTLLALARQADLPGFVHKANRVAVRITPHELRPFDAPPASRGVAPALPTVVPPEVRRLLAGRREVVVAVPDADVVRLVPATWGARFALAPAPGDTLPPGRPAVVAADDGARTGLRLDGTLDGRGALVPRQVTWWHGLAHGTADVPAPSAGLELPD